MEVYEVIEYNHDPEQKKKNWNIAVGLQQVDNLQPSSYLKELAQKNVLGDINNREVEKLLYQHYSIENGPVKDSSREKECDIVSNRIVELLETKGFLLQPSSLKSIHRYLFKDIYEFAGEYRTLNISKKEPVLNQDSVMYCNYFMIEETLSYDFQQEKNFSYSILDSDERVKRIADFTSHIWQVHPFMEGNTRTTAVFIERYLNEIGFSVNNELFKDNALFFRNALVRANYANYSKNIDFEKKYLLFFFENLLEKKNHALNNDLLYISQETKEQVPIQER